MLFDSKMTTDSWFPEQLLKDFVSGGSLGEYSMIECFLSLERCFQEFFILYILEYCSAMRCSVADTHLKLLDRVVSCVSFLNAGVIE